MALPHAQPMDIINVAPLGDTLLTTVSTSLIKTDRIQLLHLVLPAHKDMPWHHVDDECTVHCLEGEVEVVTGNGVMQLNAGNVVVMPAQEQHSLRARQNSAVLVTLLLRNGDAGKEGGSGAHALELAAQRAKKG